MAFVEAVKRFRDKSSLYTRRLNIFYFYASTHTYLSDFAKKTVFSASRKLEISLVPGNCLLGVRFCSRSPIGTKFLSFTLLKIKTNRKKKTDVKISTCRLTALEFDM